MLFSSERNTCSKGDTEEVTGDLVLKKLICCSNLLAKKD
jgi:hypothetical protein